MLALAAIDTTEITDLSTVRNASAFEVLERDKVNWTVAKQPIGLLSTGQVIPNHYAMVRGDTGHTLGIVGNRYQPIQNQHGLDLFDAAAQRGAVEYGRAGTFKGGRIVWMQAKLPDSLRIGPDEVGKYLLLANTHDGSGTLRILLTPIRVVCRNTLAAALKSDAGMTIRHTFAADAKVKAATAAIALAGQHYERFAEAGNFMVRRQYTRSMMEGYVDRVFPTDNETGKPSARLENIRARVLSLTETGKGQYAVRGTAWAAYNAVTEYVDHFRVTRGDDANRLESAWLGSGAEIKRRAFDVAVNW